MGALKKQSLCKRRDIKMTSALSSYLKARGRPNQLKQIWSLVFAQISKVWFSTKRLPTIIVWNYKCIPVQWKYTDFYRHLNFSQKSKVQMLLLSRLGTPWGEHRQAHHCDTHEGWEGRTRECQLLMLHLGKPDFQLFSFYLHLLFSPTVSKSVKVPCRC